MTAMAPPMRQRCFLICLDKHMLRIEMIQEHVCGYVKWDMKQGLYLHYILTRQAKSASYSSGEAHGYCYIKSQMLDDICLARERSS